MSDKSDNSPERTLGQANSGNKSGNVNSGSAEELLQLQCESYRLNNQISRLILGFLTGAFFGHLAMRMGRLLQGSWLPSSGIADAKVVSALLDIQENSIKPMVKRIGATAYQPGAANMFKFRDFAFRETDQAKSAETMSPSSRGVAEKKPASKNIRKPKGK